MKQIRNFFTTLVLAIALAAGIQAALAQEVFFSLDAGSDVELSDPSMSGAKECLDPGDAYSSSSALKCGYKGDINDMDFFVGSDPFPSKGIATGIPFGNAFPIMGAFADYFDMDAIDVINTSLADLGINPNTPLGSGDRIRVESLTEEQLTGIRSVQNIVVSYDDDSPATWKRRLSAPVNSVASDGSVYGTSAGDDELISFSLMFSASVDLYSVTFNHRAAEEDDVNVFLAPNPVPGVRGDDDDIDALDVQDEASELEFVYFSADNEAHNGLDPGAIYVSAKSATSPGADIALQGEIHLGLDPDADVDAFEFAIIQDVDGQNYLGVLFSVDENNPDTPPDESGGLNPGYLYGSFMDNATPVTISRLMSFAGVEDKDLDAIATTESILDLAGTLNPPGDDG